MRLRKRGGRDEDRVRESNSANARLIAAAPEMLAALERAAEELRILRMWAHGRDMDSAYAAQVQASERAARAAIAKASGREA